MNPRAAWRIPRKRKRMQNPVWKIRISSSERHRIQFPRNSQPPNRKWNPGHQIGRPWISVGDPASAVVRMSAAPPGRGCVTAVIWPDAAPTATAASIDLGVVPVPEKCQCLQCWEPPEEFTHGIDQQHCPNCTFPMDTDPDRSFEGCSVDAFCPACHTLIITGGDPEQIGWKHPYADSGDQ